MTITSVTIAQLIAGLKAEKNVHIYLRVSSKAQDIGRTVSLDMQEADIKQTLADLGLKEVSVVREVGSAWTCKQPQLDALVEGLQERKQPAVILVHSLDRFSRNLGRVCQFLDNPENKNILVIANNFPLDYRTATGKLQLFTAYAQAEYQSALLSEKVRAALAFKRRQGAHIGTALYGTRLVTVRTVQRHGRDFEIKRLAVDPVEDRILRFMLLVMGPDAGNKGYANLVQRAAREIKGIKVDIYDHSKITARDLANYLNESKILYRKGRKWTSIRVRGFVQRGIFDIAAAEEKDLDGMLDDLAVSEESKHDAEIDSVDDDDLVVPKSKRQRNMHGKVFVNPSVGVERRSARLSEHPSVSFSSSSSSSFSFSSSSSSSSSSSAGAVASVSVPPVTGKRARAQLRNVDKEDRRSK